MVDALGRIRPSRWAVVLGAVCLAGVLGWQALTQAGAPDPTTNHLSRPAVVLDSAILVLREGLEAILVLAALAASMLGTNAGRRRPVAAGAGFALVASVLTWFGVVAVISAFVVPCHKMFGHRLDVTDSASIKTLVNFAVEDMGGIDIWVNNAGIYPTKLVVDMTDQDWDKVLDVNLRGTFIGAREAAKQMIAGGKGGVIINLASTAGYQAGGPGLAHYVASKHGVRGLTKSLAVEFGPYGIRVLALAPTLIDTPGITVLREQAKQAAGGAPIGDLLEQLATREPLGRAGVPDDVARVALFCASDLSMLMTGSTLLVDAGDVAV